MWQLSFGMGKKTLGYLYAVGTGFPSIGVERAKDKPIAERDRRPWNVCLLMT